MYNILVCDDDRDIRNALRIYLSGEGYGVLEASNGEEALCRFASVDKGIHNKTTKYGLPTY